MGERLAITGFSVPYPFFTNSYPYTDNVHSSSFCIEFPLTIGHVSVEISDLTLDDQLNDTERIQKYCISSIALQRLVHVRLINETCRSIGFLKAKESIFPLFTTLVQDEEYMVRMTLAEQLRGVAELCAKYLPTTSTIVPSSTSITTTTPSTATSPSSTASAVVSTALSSSVSTVGYLCLGDELLPLIATLLVDPQPEVRTAAGETLVTMASYIKRDDLGPRVLTIVLSLAHDDDQEELRMLAAVLLNELADTLGPDLCYQFVTSEIICLAEDPVFRVRKAAATNLDAICRTSGPTHTAKRILPAFIQLTQDDIWGVRKACTESMVAVSKCLDPTVRVNELVPVMERFINDSSKWVRASAASYLGPFLGTLPGNRITPLLLSHYIRMGLPHDTNSSNSTGLHSSSSSAIPGTTNTSGTNTGTNNSSASSGSTTTNTYTNSILHNLPARIGSDPAEAELAVHCAFSFPAVTLTLGRTRWSELRSLFTSLSRDIQLKVRRPLSHSLHELARILGPEISESDLIPAMELYLRDNDEVKAGVIKSFASFLSILSVPARDAYVPVLEELRTGSLPHNWRFRRMLALQLSSFAVLFSAQVTYDIVVPFAVALLKDTVAVVRDEAVQGISALINRLGTSDAVQQMNFINTLLSFSTAPSYRDRLLFVHIASNVSKHCDVNLFRRHFMEPLLALVNEKVRNVRVALAFFLGSYTLAYLTVNDRKQPPSTVITTVVPSGTGTMSGNNENVTGNAPSTTGLTTVNSDSSSSSSPTKDGSVSSVPVLSSEISEISITKDILSPPSVAVVLNEEIYKDIDEESYPMWIREDTNNLYLNAVIKLAHDNDNEVVQQLPLKWIERYRTEPVPNIMEYIRQHAQLIYTGSSSSSSSTTIASTDSNPSSESGSSSSQDTAVSDNSTPKEGTSSSTNGTVATTEISPTDEAAAAVIAKHRASLVSSHGTDTGSLSTHPVSNGAGGDLLVQNHLHTLQDTLNMSLLHKGTSWDTTNEEAEAIAVVEDGDEEVITTSSPKDTTPNAIPSLISSVPGLTPTNLTNTNNGVNHNDTGNEDDDGSSALWDAAAAEVSSVSSSSSSVTANVPLPIRSNDVPVPPQ